MTWGLALALPLRRSFLQKLYSLNISLFMVEWGVLQRCLHLEEMNKSKILSIGMHGWTMGKWEIRSLIVKWETGSCERKFGKGEPADRELSGRSVLGKSLYNSWEFISSLPWNCQSAPLHLETSSGICMSSFELAILKKKKN